ncbi:RFC checkpoint protein Rad17 [Blastocladiella emersonii ATCC 22665]|nr:RFC checkpoint protein Rad17 [Blastocladiella emersonii ATCC 22665]
MKPPSSSQSWFTSASSSASSSSESAGADPPRRTTRSSTAKKSAASKARAASGSSSTRASALAAAFSKSEAKSAEQQQGGGVPKLRLTPPLLKRAPSDTLWIDEHRPETVSDLVVHNGKVKQIQAWMSESYKTQPFLAATGPSGTGKLCTVEAVARSLKLTVVEWTNPALAGGSGNTDFRDEDTAPTVLESFLDFLARGTRYAKDDDLFLLRDYPIFSASGLERAQAAIRGMLRARRRIPRIVLLFTDFNLPSDTDSGDRWASSSSSSSNIECPTLRVLFPADSLHACHVISFNPVAPSLLKKALSRIALAHGVRCNLQPIIDSCHGDLRAAINTLQFSALTLGRSARDAELCSTERSRSLFRAIGRPMLNKRLPAPPPPASATPTPSSTQGNEYLQLHLPPHLAQWTRAPLEVEPADLLVNLQVSSDFYALCLHANYPEYITRLSGAVFLADEFAAADALRNPVADLARLHAVFLAHGVADPVVDADLSSLIGGQDLDWDAFDMDADSSDDDEDEDAASALSQSLTQTQSQPAPVAGSQATVVRSRSDLTASGTGDGELEPPASLLGAALEVDDLTAGVDWGAFDSLDAHTPVELAPHAASDSQSSAASSVRIAPTPPLSRPVRPPPPPAPTSVAPTSRGGRASHLMAMVRPDHYDRTKVMRERRAALARLGVRPEEAPFPPHRRAQEQQRRHRALAERSFEESIPIEELGMAAAGGEEAEEEEVVPGDAGLTRLGYSSSRIHNLLAAMGATRFPPVVALGGVLEEGGVEEEEEEDPIVD